MRADFEPTFEQRSLFNPAFCAVLVHAAASGHSHGALGRPLPLPLTYIVLPLALHQQTRLELPKTTRTSMVSWVQCNPLVLHGLSRRVSELRPFVSDGIVLALHTEVVETDPQGRLAPHKLKRRPSGFQPTKDWADCVKTAEFVGKWMSKKNLDLTTLLAIWGFRP